MRAGLPGPSHAVVVLIAVLLLAVNLRAAVTGLSPLLPRVTRDTGLTSAEVGLVGALPPFCFAAAALLGPVLLRRQAAERLALLALGLAVTGQALRPWAPGAAGFLVTSVLALLGLGTGNVVLPVLVKAYFPDRIGAVTALYVTALTVGTALPPLVAVPLADALASRAGSAATGWRLALVGWALTGALAMLPWLRPAARPRAVPAAHPPAAPSASPPDAPADAAPRGGSRPPRMGTVAHCANPVGAEAHRAADGRALPVYRSRVAWGVLLVFGVNSLITYALFAWLPLRLVEAGLPDGVAGQALSVFAGLGLPSALVVPVLAARLRRQFPMVVLFGACMVTGLTGLLVAPQRLTLLWALIAGVGGSGFPLALTLIGLRTRTPAAAGVLSGFAQGFGYLGAGFGPLVVGALRQATGGWAAPFGVLLASVALALLGGALAGRPRTVEDDLASRPPRREFRSPARIP